MIEKGKPVERQGRKAASLRLLTTIVGLPQASCTEIVHEGSSMWLALLVEA
jgi:hypothetical protein